MSEAFNNWLSKVRELFQNEANWDYAEMSQWYSFKSAWEDGKTPQAAIKDAIEWMEA